jgi:succinate dehydrogenase / fumarate reductase cytochrome b subunit
MDRAERPLSPHLQVYRFRITMILSSLHRICGLLLTVGALVLAWWLIALASGPTAYTIVENVFTTAWFRVLLVLWTFSFFFHLSNGVRHLVWDSGLGFEPSQIRASGWIVVIVSALAAIVFALVVIV